jgi:hypothetical protein
MSDKPTVQLSSARAIREICLVCHRPCRCFSSVVGARVLCIAASWCKSLPTFFAHTMLQPDRFPNALMAQAGGSMVDNEACAAVISDKLREGGLNSADDAVFAMSVSTFLNLESARDRGASDADNEASVVAAEASSDFRSRAKSGGKKLHVSTDADQSVEDVPADEGNRLARTVSVSVREVAANPSKFLCTPKGTKCAARADPLPSPASSGPSRSASKSCLGRQV